MRGEPQAYIRGRGLVSQPKKMQVTNVRVSKATSLKTIRSGWTGCIASHWKVVTFTGTCKVNGKSVRVVFNNMDEFDNEVTLTDRRGQDGYRGRNRIALFPLEKATAVRTIRKTANEKFGIGSAMVKYPHSGRRVMTVRALRNQAWR